MSAQDILQRVAFSKEIRSGQWVCECPAHKDNSPSLRVTETDSGKVLLKCWAGCGALDILTSLGLDWGALFPDKFEQRSTRKRDDRVEDYIVEFAEYAKRTGKRLSASDKMAYAKALRRGGKPNGFVDEVVRQASVD